MTIEIYLQGLIKMWWIFLPVFIALIGTSISERREKRARLKTKRINRRGKQMQHKF